MYLSLISRDSRTVERCNEMSDISEMDAIIESSLYTEIKTLSDGKSIVMDPKTEKLYYRKQLDVYSIPVFKFLKENRHKNIPKIKIFWEEDEKLIVIEELVQGETLDKLLSERLSFEEKKRILLEICDGLTFLHSAVPPVIHRDIKASNIMVADDGSVIIVDYDAAKQYITSKNKDTVLIGTVGSAAPEQYGFGQSDERTDIYALGKLIERMLPNAPHAVPIVEKATKLDPSMRYKSVKEMKVQIEKLWDPSISDSEHRKMLLKKKLKSRWFKLMAAILLIAAFLATVGIIFKSYIYPEYFVRRPIYQEGVDAMDNGDFETAYEKLSQYPDYRDAAERMEVCDKHIQDAKFRKQAEQSIADYNSEKNPEDAGEALGYLKSLKEKGLDDGQMMEDFMKVLEADAEACKAENTAQSRFRADDLYDLMGKYGYEGAEDGKKDVIYHQADVLYDEGDYDYAGKLFNKIPGYKDADSRAKECSIKYGQKLIDDKEYIKAVEYLEALEGNDDLSEMINRAKYLYCDEKKLRPDIKARNYVEDLLEQNYPGAELLNEIIYEWHVSVEISYNKATKGYQISVSGNLYGGKTSDKVNIKAVLTLENGDGVSTVLENRNNSNNKKINWFPMYYGADGIEGHTVHVDFYDDNGKLIGSSERQF